MLQSLSSSLRRRAVLVASGTAVVLAVGGGTAAFAATGESAAPNTATSTTCAPHLAALLRGATPGALKADLKQLRSEPKADRAADRKAVAASQQLLADGLPIGGYGVRAERLAHLAAGKAGRDATFRASLPAALQADLKTLRATAPKSDEREAAAQKIAAEAVAGDYGTTIQTRAKAVQARVQQRCEAKAAK